MKIVSVPLDSSSRNLRHSVTELVRSSWGDPGDLPERWFKSADRAIAAFDRGHQLMGVALLRRIESDVLWSIVTVVGSEEWLSGITVRLHAAFLRNLWVRKILLSNPLSVGDPFYLVCRTANPRVYSLLAKRFPVYPSLDGRPPTRREVDLLWTVHSLTGGEPPDEERFVLPSTYQPYPGLIPDVADVTWSGDEAIDRMFADRLRLQAKKGDMLFLIARISPLSILRQSIEQGTRTLLRPRR